VSSEPGFVAEPSPSHPDAGDRVDAARRAIAENPIWYHTLELAPGVVTPGQIDLRQTAAKLLPDDLSGKRALDVGTFDGFWAFELERRGAEVVAIDLESADASQWSPLERARLEGVAQEWDIQLGRGFRLASGLLDSRVERVICSVLDVTPEAVGGSVDLVFMGALLIHLRDPVRALERLFQVLTPGGQLHQLEGISLPLSLMHPKRPVAQLQIAETEFNWWYANWAALKAWLVTAGFVDIRGRGLHHPPQPLGMKGWYRGIVSRRPA
jgi:SAM-dependent methyltransferase